MQNLMIGGASRTIAGSILLPFTVIKARYESGFFGYTGVTDAFSAIYRREGVRGLWSGMCATVLRDAPFSGESRESLRDVYVTLARLKGLLPFWSNECIVVSQFCGVMNHGS